MSFTRKREESKLPSWYVLIGGAPKVEQGFSREAEFRVDDRP